MDEGVGEVRDLEEPRVPVERESVPGEGEPVSRRLVEPVKHHDRDRDQGVEQHQPDVGRQDEASPPPPRPRWPEPGRAGDRCAAHAYSWRLRVPKARAYRYIAA